MDAENPRLAGQVAGAEAVAAAAEAVGVSVLETFA